jgi:hypothetical protein
MKTDIDPPMELAAIEHPTQSTRHRFPDDDKLRAAGWAIHGRPKAGEPVWTKGGVLLRHSEALLRLDDECRGR